MNLQEFISKHKVRAAMPVIRSIHSHHEKIKGLPDEEFPLMTQRLKESVQKGESLDDILPEAFAAVYEASVRVLGLTPHDEQMLGGIFLHRGCIAELKTGEGKTLVAAFPAYLNALTGKGVHVVTVNDYLAERDAEEMGRVYSFLGLSTGLVLATMMDPEERKLNYMRDITYVTNSELGFDYLKDNMALTTKDMMQRGLHFALIDEVDSILIDEARTPLIISSKGGDPGWIYRQADEFVRTLKKGKNKLSGQRNKLDYLDEESLLEDGDFSINEKDNIAVLTEEGVKKAEKFFHIANFSDEENIHIQHAVTMALKAHWLMQKDKDYIIRKGEVMIVDEFTGRVMDGRRFSDGLHQALEAKEGVEIHSEDDMLATITYQSFFNKYEKKCGMTGTAMTEYAEFADIYHMPCVQIPTHKPIARMDDNDVVFMTKEEKFRAAGKRIKEAHKIGQPVLAGTSAVEDSEYLSNILDEMRIPHQVLNAKQDAHEAQIISEAGRFGAVTIATNMAGRGTDIKLDEKARKAGGLFVLGTDRSEARRVDNQLRGRSGRQGDPGYSVFYLSLEDDLMRLFGSEKTKKAMTAVKVKNGQPLAHGMLSRSVTTAQKAVEANNFAIRKNLVDYDGVVDRHRSLIYDLRKNLMGAQLIKHAVMDMILGMVRENYKKPEDRETVLKLIEDIFPLHKDEKERILSLPDEAFIHDTCRVLYKVYDRHEAFVGSERMRQEERRIILGVTDKHWVQHINNMEKLKVAVSLEAYAQRDPLVRYKLDGYQMFAEMLEKIREESLELLMTVMPVVKINGVESGAQRMKFRIGGV